MRRAVPLVETLSVELRRSRYSLAVAESCTGGGLGAAITELPGVSSFFRGGVIAYSNAVKSGLLNVPEAVLDQYGAVSEQTARAMADGVRDRLNADVGIAITGIAGPDGGSDEKPVGLVYIATTTPRRSLVRRDVWPGTRQEVREASVQAALDLAVRALRASD